MSRDYKRKERRTKRLLLEPNSWYSNYRSLHLIVIHLNDCIGEVFMPVHMLLVSMMTGFALYGLVVLSAKIGSIFTILCITCLLLLGAYYTFLIGRGASFSTALQLALSLRAETCATKYLVRVNRACCPVRPAVGGFFPLKGQTVSTMVSTGVEFGVDLMLM